MALITGAMKTVENWFYLATSAKNTDLTNTEAAFKITNPVLDAFAY